MRPPSLLIGRLALVAALGCVYLSGAALDQSDDAALAQRWRPTRQRAPLPLCSAVVSTSDGARQPCRDGGKTGEPLKRSLKKKRRQLKRLREEVRQMRQQLHRRALDKPASDEASTPRGRRKGRPSNKGGKAKAEKGWRQRMLRRLRRLNRRLDALEVQDEGLTEARGTTATLMATPPVAPTSASTATTVAAPSSKPPKSKKAHRGKKSKQRRQRRKRLRKLLKLPTAPVDRSEQLQSAANDSKRGEGNATCAAHADCKPGLCCHSATAEAPASERRCVVHQLAEGAPCDDSCQCASSMHCFRGAVVNATEAFCKSVSAEDIINGQYMNAKHSYIVDSL